MAGSATGCALFVIAACGVAPEAIPPTSPGAVISAADPDPAVVAGSEASGAVRPGACAAPDTALDRLVTQFVTETGLPGAFLALFDEEHQANSAAGATTGTAASTTAGPPIGPSTAFYLGSNGKAITASVIASLVEQGILDWERTVEDIFEAAQSAEPGDPAIHPDLRDVTIAELLRHQSGIDAFTDDAAFEAATAYAGPPRDARRRYARDVLALAPEHPRGETHYSNAGIVIAAAMAEAQADRDFESLAAQHVFEPLGVRGGFGPPPTDRGDAAALHTWREGSGYLRVEESAIPVFGPAGDVWMEAGGYARFAQAHLRGMRGRGTAGFLSAASMARLHEPINGYAMGWRSQEYDGAPLMQHSGGAGASLAMVFLRPDSGLGYVILANGAGGPTEEGMISLFKAVDEKWHACVGVDFDAGARG